MSAPAAHSAPPAPVALPANIGAVIARLETIMDDCARSGNRLGFFAALYYKVTCRVRDGILVGEFEDNARMERLDVVFANRYIHAWDRFQSGAGPTASWDLCFRAAEKRGLLVLQHLLLGMNAHINLDLGIAAVEVAGPAGLKAIRKDFNAINGILATLSGDVMSSLRRVSPLLSLLGLHATRYNSILIQFSLSNARDGAWCFAEDLDGATPDAYHRTALDRDASIAALASGLTRAKGPVRLTLAFIRLFEWNNPKKILNVLREGAPAKVRTATMES
jgi:hypothetical protein